MITLDVLLMLIGLLLWHLATKKALIAETGRLIFFCALFWFIYRIHGIILIR